MEIFKMHSSSEFLFYNKLNEECLHLLVETRDYLQYQSPVDQQCMTSSQRLTVTCLAMRLTARLTDIMGWVLEKKSEFSSEKLQFSNSIYMWNELPELNMSDPFIPQNLKSLSERAENLFERAQRLSKKN
jgi:regulator of CtrA degradation